MVPVMLVSRQTSNPLNMPPGVPSARRWLLPSSQPGTGLACCPSTEPHAVSAPDPVACLGSHQT
ncbi:hypothetical protein P7K49_002104, partial [Saguinus oedipus]